MRASFLMHNQGKARNAARWYHPFDLTAKDIPETRLRQGVAQIARQTVLTARAKM